MGVLTATAVFLSGVFVSTVMGASMPKGFGEKQQVECRPEWKKCTYKFIIHEKLTMMKYKQMLYPYEGKLYPCYVKSPPGNDTAPIPPSEIIPADGWTQSRVVYVVNNSMPGPPVEVYEGQTVVIEVHNAMRSESTSLHMHGLHQKGTPFMDGVAFVTQCPILPGQSFTYRFKVKQLGTYWYHAHVGAQRSMGIYGAFIIRPKPKSQIELDNIKMNEHVVMLSDWNHDWESMNSYLRMVLGGFDGLVKTKASQSLDGMHYSNFRFQSGLINGLGRYYNPDTGKHNDAPLTVFTVKHNQTVRLRVIAAGNLYPFRVSVDNHQLRVISSDGMDVEPTEVESVIINPGERYDVVIDTDQTAGNYWIRAVTLEVGKKYHIAEAILRYEGAPDAEPITERKKCTSNDVCMVVNCPFLYYPESDYTKCITVDQLKNTQNDTVPEYELGKSKEYFLNFAFPGADWTPGSVNGHAFTESGISALTQPELFKPSCSPTECGEEKTCLCTLTLDLKYNDTVQMVLMNLGRGRGWAHPMHLHGHSFYVVKMGFADYDNVTGKLTNDTKDIDCRGNPDPKQSYCNKAAWSNSSWGGDDIPGINLENPPRKDTVIIPSGGYAVIRIKADNPGVWIFHCHIEMHNLDGMSMLVTEALDHVPPIPKRFPTCHGFEFTDADEEEYEKVLASSSGSRLVPTAFPTSCLLFVLWLFYLKSIVHH
ncbi:uncharacterized protein LOC141908958 [Tubulanus polymorphus]|uniref:uncharacterized protein LOC141908958 n=1 Tax=Tubulanus polymorphus TaxID=672921 RepID=UPI003DA4971A